MKLYPDIKKLKLDNKASDTVDSVASVDSGETPPPKKKNRKGFLGKLIPVLLVPVILLGLGSSFYTVDETEYAVVTTFGKASAANEKGLHFKIPFVQQIVKVPSTVQGIQIGYNENEEGEYDIIEHESIMITSDFNFVDTDFYVTYQVSDPIKYLYASNEPDVIVKDISLSSIRSVVSAYSVDAVITTGKSEIQANVKSMIRESLEEEDIGVTLIDAVMQDSEPPTNEVKAAFTAVETARQDKETAINNANAYRNKTLPAAEAEADKILQEAAAAKTARINEATGQAARFEAEYAEYSKYPLITKQRMFLETMTEVLPDLKVVIDNGDGNILKYYPIDSLGSIAQSGTNQSDSSQSGTSQSE